MTMETATLKFEVKPTSSGGYVVEVSPKPADNLGCFGTVLGSKPGGQKNWNFDL